MADMTSSHSEREIFDGCVALMQELTDHFQRYLEYIGVDVKEEDDEERFGVKFYNTAIVERLFLWNTSHSGGTSQRMKCRELGLDESGTVTFEDERWKEANDG